MKLDPVELRGVGIQITKLDGETGKPADRESGQGMLSFRKKRDEGSETRAPSVAPVKTGNATIAPEGNAAANSVDERIEARSRSRSLSRGQSLSRTQSPQYQPEPPKDKDPALPPALDGAISHRPAPRVAVAGPSRLAPAASSEGIDPDFLAALPDELRQEVKRDHAITRARARAESEKPANDKTIGTVIDRERAATISPTKALSRGTHATAHITKQLRPRVKTQLKASAISELPLYGAWNKAKVAQDEIVDLSAEADVGDLEKVGNYFIKDLKELGIDPLFLKDLPEEMQKEVVDQEMAVRNRRSLLHRPADTSRVRAKERARASASPTRSSRAGSAPVVPRVIGPTITRPAKPKLYNATTLPEVTEIITKWIDSRKGSGPAIKDANKVKAYLVKCMQPEYGLGGMEMAIEVLRFMRVAIDDRWEEEGCEDDLAGREWWETWRGFKGAIDQLCRKSFGAGLRL
jgi:DNA repair protein REV1